MTDGGRLQATFASAYSQQALLTLVALMTGLDRHVLRAGIGQSC